MNDCTFAVFTVTHVSIFVRVPEMSSPEVSTNGANAGRLLHKAALNPFMWDATTEVPIICPFARHMVPCNQWRRCGVEARVGAREPGGGQAGERARAGASPALEDTRRSKFTP